MDIVFFIPASFFVILLLIGLGLFGLGMQAILWVANNIIIISVVIWAVIFLVTLLLTEPSEHILGISYVCPFIPFYMGAVGLLFYWVNLLGNGGLWNLLNFIVYIFAIPLGLAIHIIPSILILVASHYLCKDNKTSTILVNLALALLYTLAVCANGGTLVT